METDHAAGHPGHAAGQGAGHATGHATGHANHAAGHGGHTGGHGDHAAQFRDRFWLSVLLSVPVVLYSEMIQRWLGFTAPTFPGSGWRPARGSPA